MTERNLIRKIRRELEKENLFVRTIRDFFGNNVYVVIDTNNVIQTSEQGMSLEELATYAGIDISVLEETN